MTITESALIFALTVTTIFQSQLAHANELVWGKNVGYVSGITASVDDVKGLAVRSEPSLTAKTLIHLKPGTKIQGKNVFRDGWVQVRSPVHDGWVQMSFVQPDRFEGTVIKVGSADLCLPLQKGPADSYEQIGCAQIGEVLTFSGVATHDDWLQLADRKGWVPASHVGLDAWASAARTIEQQTSSSDLQPSFRKGTEEQGPLARQLEPGFPAHPPDEEDEGESPDARICSNDWCVDFVSNIITREGKPESFVACSRDEICATIMAEFWIALLEDDEHVDIPISNAISIRLGRDGSMRNAASGELFKDCRGASGPEVDCAVRFLLDISQPVLATAETESMEPIVAPLKDSAASSNSPSQSQASDPGWPKGTAAAAASAEPSESAKPDSSTKEPATRKSKPKEARVPSARSKKSIETDSISPAEMFTDPFFDQEAAQNKHLEDSWDDAIRRGY